MNAPLSILLLALVAPGPDSKIVTSEALAKANADLRARLAAKDEHIPPREAGSVTITEDQRNCAAILLGDARTTAEEILEVQAEVEALQARIADLVKQRDAKGAAISTAELEKENLEKRLVDETKTLEEKKALEEKSSPTRQPTSSKTAAAIEIDVLKRRYDADRSKQDQIISAATKEIDGINASISRANQRINTLRQKKSGLERSFDREVRGHEHGGEHAKEHGGTGHFTVNRQMRRCLRQRQNARIEAQIEAEKGTFRAGFRAGREARCKTALCWGPSNKFAFEPLAELPVGKTFALSHSGLARYINGTDVDVSFTAGLRFWSHWDWFSVGIYLSKPLVVNRDLIHVSGSTHEFNSSQIRRPYPGLAIGLFGDMLWISLDYDQLRNGNTGDQRAPEFRPNDVVSHTLTLSVAIAPVTGFRNGIGLGTELARKRRADDAAAAAAAAAASTTQKAAEAATNAEIAEQEAASSSEAGASTGGPSGDTPPPATPTGDAPPPAAAPASTSTPAGPS
ncbi:MAG TPA: hypothetical protein PKW35_09805 [Nannocystaceae bacterium]|nr:hypothetical protein [Nannocystaceae bacterium]